jgi:hypothetical protein
MRLCGYGQPHVASVTCGEDTSLCLSGTDPQTVAANAKSGCVARPASHQHSVFRHAWYYCHLLLLMDGRRHISSHVTHKHVPDWWINNFLLTTLQMSLKTIAIMSDVLITVYKHTGETWGNLKRAFCAHRAGFHRVFKGCNLGKRALAVRALLDLYTPITGRWIVWRKPIILNKAYKGDRISISLIAKISVMWLTIMNEVRSIQNHTPDKQNGLVGR